MSEWYQCNGRCQRGQRERKRELLWQQSQDVTPVECKDWHQNGDAERQTKDDEKEDGELSVEGEALLDGGLWAICPFATFVCKYGDDQEGERDEAKAEPEREGERAAEPKQQTPADGSAGQPAEHDRVDQPEDQTTPAFAVVVGDAGVNGRPDTASPNAVDRVQQQKKVLFARLHHDGQRQRRKRDAGQ